jgi:hypothetical protein
MERIRKELALKFNEFEDHFVVDSMPLEVCKLSRATRSKYVRRLTMQYPIQDIVPFKKVIFMTKLHAVCSFFEFSRL